MTSANDSKSNPDVSDHLAEANNAKATGGGVKAGSTDFGPSTAATQGGTGSVGADASRSVSAGQTGSSDEALPRSAGTIGAAGNSVTATGRPTSDDSRGGTGAAGSGAVVNDRAVDIVEGRAAGPVGNLANQRPPQDHDEDQQ